MPALSPRSTAVKSIPKRCPRATATPSATVITPVVTSAPTPIHVSITGRSDRESASRTARIDGGAIAGRKRRRRLGFAPSGGLSSSRAAITLTTTMQSRIGSVPSSAVAPRPNTR